MSGLIPEAVKRRVSAAVTAAVLLIVVCALLLVALGAFAFALHHHWRPTLGPELAWWISGGILLAVALLIALIARWRLRSAGTVHHHPAPREEAAQTSPDMALQMAALMRDELPRHAVPATVLALVAGIAVGLNPQAIRAVVDSLGKKTD